MNSKKYKSYPAYPSPALSFLLSIIIHHTLEEHISNDLSIDALLDEWEWQIPIKLKCLSK